MHNLLQKATIATLFLASWAGSVQTADAQAFWGREYNRGLRPGTQVPYDGMPYTQRYSYATGGFLYFNKNPHYLNYMDYLDRASRAYYFGHKMPRDPLAHVPPPPPSPIVEEIVEEAPPRRRFFIRRFR